MGLDMYLFKRRVHNDGFSEDKEIMYWRKANQIREWFASHLANSVENCKESDVTKADLEALLDDCCAVLKDHSLAPKLLPTAPGFFFGSTDYDDWYYSDLEETVAKLLKIINEVDWDKEEVYYYEWW